MGDGGTSAMSGGKRVMSGDADDGGEEAIICTSTSCAMIGPGDDPRAPRRRPMMSLRLTALRRFLKLKLVGGVAAVVVVSPALSRFASVERREEPTSEEEERMCWEEEECVRWPADMSSSSLACLLPDPPPLPPARCTDGRTGEDEVIEYGDRPREALSVAPNQMT